MRGVNSGKPFWVMEEQSGAAGWEIFGPHPLPGEIRLWAYQGIAHGADAIVYFRWRTCRFGTEEYWHGVLDHDGVPRRRYEEVKKMGEELKNLTDLVGSRYKAEAAIIYSYDIRWAFDIQPNNPSFNYMEQIQRYYAGLFNQHVPVDIVNPLSNLSRYKLVIAPSLYLMTPQIRENLERYVREGGTLVVTPRSGVKDWNNVVTDKTLPGELADLLGVEIEEYYSIPGDERYQIKGIGPEKYSCKAICELISPKSAEVIAQYEDGPFAGKPAATINRFGNGEAIYIGADVDIQYIESLLFWLITRCRIDIIVMGPKEVEVTVREGKDGVFIFLLNHSDKAEAVKLSFPGSIEEIMLEPGDVKIIKR
jgi:beta-galactosidase